MKKIMLFLLFLVAVALMSSGRTDNAQFGIDESGHVCCRCGDGCCAACDVNR